MPAKSSKKKQAKRIPACPQCQSTQVVPIVHGIPNTAQSKAIKLGRAIVADREEWEGMSEWYCKSCGTDWSRHSQRFKKPGGVNATRSNR
jgi:tRNA U54 and U55 pseudouridine synthase Pus10